MITTDRMAAVDANAAALGVPRKQLMESSGNAVAREVRALADPGASVDLLCGRGNNGGDAFVAARFLSAYDVTVRLLGRPESIRTEIARENWAALERAEIPTETVADAADLALDGPDVIVDAMLGSGVTGALREPERTAARLANESDAAVVAVDVPSGIDADTGEPAGSGSGEPTGSDAGSAVRVEADRVVTFHDEKPGLAALDAEVTVADIGIPAAAERFTGPGDLLGLARDPDSHKGENGEVLVIGGGPYTGAPSLSARSALRTGADLVRVACPETVAGTVQGYSADLIVRGLPGDRVGPAHVDRALELAAGNDAVVLGPGLGDGESASEFVREFLSRYDGRAVVDADALRVVPEVDTGAELICTPHQGELVEMGGETADDPDERAALVRSFADEIGHTLLVKGAVDVASDGDAVRLNRTGNPGMTVGGTGDVLAGAVGALAAVTDPFRAAAVGAYVNGLAGDAAAEEMGYGLVATDLPDRLPEAMRDE
ncbi:bifunctional ADP-dependent NAD(P)H-hydrate dehydratase/NAD(P)H-hydrate epimerase [Halorubrum lipolyticum]|uniref:Bifunctional NAD(P)H-hydrate repair enzyme n=1 Tax=Halorubrum lipolyticum DSM 21995 TaxID=1227482 RepID=M0P0M1_9EURY|nr:bifunctional ADP-dependent NAD(P)H-hydrate dehydratase/NAD(P)H-hydrate epimerase [Halorubrum lipolyticum]EMA63722.1 carbohydrate kinase, YjeF related protein [Halorubrum lipolyticum DSM 21995]